MHKAADLTQGRQSSVSVAKGHKSNVVFLRQGRWLVVEIVEIQSKGISACNINRKNVSFKPSHVARLTRGLGLTSHPKDRGWGGGMCVINNKSNLLKLIYVTVWVTAMTAAQGVAGGDRTPDLLIKKQAT